MALSLADKMWIQTLREQCLGAKALLRLHIWTRAGPSAQWRRFVSVFIKQGRQKNVKLVVVGRNLCSLKQTLLLSFFNAEKSVGGHLKKSIASSFFNRIIFYLAVRCRTVQKVNLQNFKLKFQTVAEKTAKNFRGLLYFAPPCIHTDRQMGWATARLH